MRVGGWILMSCTGPPWDDQFSVKTFQNSSRMLTLSGVKATKAIHTAGLLELPFHTQLTHGTYIRTLREQQMVHYVK